MNKTSLAAAFTLSLLVVSTTARAEEAVLTRGKQVFDRWCAACHADGPNYTGTIALRAKYKGSMPAALEERTDLSADAVKYFVRRGVSIMAPYRKTEISDAELADLAAYVARGNGR